MAARKTAKTTPSKKTTPAKKAPAKKTTAKKKATAKKAPARKTTAGKKTAAKKPMKVEYTAEQVYSMIEQAAYFAAENDGFSKDPAEYWASAEAAINGMIRN